MQTTNCLSSIELSALYKVPMDLINNGIQNGDLIVENNKISLKEFRLWCDKYHIECETKKCPTCGRDLPLYRYGRHVHHKDGLEATCLKCKQSKPRETKKVEAESFGAKRQSAPEKITLSAFSREYKLTEVEIIRLYTFITRREVTVFSLDKNDLLIDRKTAEWFLAGAFDFKRCPRCGKIKRFSEYYTYGKFWHGRQHWCKECTLRYGQDRREGRQITRAKSELDGLLEKYPILKKLIKAQ